jgi:hypothetical protein
LLRRSPHTVLRPVTALLPWAAPAALALLAAAAPAPAPTGEVEPGPALSTITEGEVEEHVALLAAPGMEGRDTPSEGQARAARHLVELYRGWGYEPAPDSLQVMGDHGGDGPDSDAKEGSFYRPFVRELDAPAPDGCALALVTDGGAESFEYGVDFVPVHRASGAARGELVFGGFGIQSSREKYDDFKGLRVAGKVVLFFEGEPRHKKKFDGEEVTEEAWLWSKLATLNRENAAAALVVRRDPVGAEEDPENGLDYRYTHAQFLDGGAPLRGPRRPSKSLPTLEISMDAATRLLGQDARALAAKMDRSARPTKVKLKGVEVSVDSATTRRPVRHDNLVMVLPGSDPELASEYLLIGAHYDHIGVGPGGRVGCGANDNASGCAALLEVAEALAESPPRRSVIVAHFTGEEDGLVGARELAKRLPVPKDRIVAMLNLDMIGFGEADEVTVLGVRRNPGLQKVLDRAERLGRTGVRTVVTGKGEELWQRSDHYAFHEIGLPVLFFFEGLPISADENYHTWRDTPDAVDHEKITNTARLVYNTAWILANDDDRPPAPRD